MCVCVCVFVCVSPVFWGTGLSKPCFYFLKFMKSWWSHWLITWSLSEKSVTRCSTIDNWLFTRHESTNTHTVVTKTSVLRSTVQLPYRVTCEVRKWGKAKGKGGAGYEASTCFMALDVSGKYQSQIHRPQEHLEIFVAWYVSDKCFCTNSTRICWVLYLLQANTNPVLPAFLK